MEWVMIIKWVEETGHNLWHQVMGLWLFLTFLDIVYPHFRHKSNIVKLFSLFLIQNICSGYSKEPSQWDGSFEHPKHILNWWVRNNLQIYANKISLSGSMISSAWLSAQLLLCYFKCTCSLHVYCKKCGPWSDYSHWNSLTRLLC